MAANTIGLAIRKVGKTQVSCGKLFATCIETRKI